MRLLTNEENCKGSPCNFIDTSILYLLINIYSLLLFSCKSNLIIPNRQIIKYANKSMNQTFRQCITRVINTLEYWYIGETEKLINNLK